MNPRKLIRSFKYVWLDGNLNRLATFQLSKLRNDETFGCPGRKFDCDDTELMRAIYCVVFDYAWENISMDNMGDGKLRGDTMNTYNTLFAHPWSDMFTARWNPDKKLLNKMKEFQNICYTIGNMTVLPDRRIGEWSINKHRGCHDLWHDYEDRFLAALYKVLTLKPDRDQDLEELVLLNKEDFDPYFGEEGWKRFIDMNMLEYYVDVEYKPVITSKGYTYWRGGYTNKERFFAECHRYIDFSTKIINERAKRMIDILESEDKKFK